MYSDGSHQMNELGKSDADAPVVFGMEEERERGNSPVVSLM